MNTPSPKEYPFKAARSFIVVDCDNYSNQLAVFTHEEHGEVFGWVSDNSGTRFPEYMQSVAELHAARNNGKVIEVFDESFQ